MEQFKTNKKNGLNRCPHCGATEIVFIPERGVLHCNHCRSEFIGEMANFQGLEQVAALQEQELAKGAEDIDKEFNDVVTFRCSSCGAEVVINTAEKLSAHCHWCKHVFSVNEQIPNGTVPDLVLPFWLSKEQAYARMKEFSRKHRFFAKLAVRRAIKPENIQGVYLPYWVVDINAHVKMHGTGETPVRYGDTELKEYLEEARKNGEKNSTNIAWFYAKKYKVEREFDLSINDLTLEASKSKGDPRNGSQTNNIINAIMPFDTQNCVAWNPAFLQGFSCERRDVNKNDARGRVEKQLIGISRYWMKSSVEDKYKERGVNWYSEDIKTVGSSWKSAYLPVWLFSFSDKDIKGNIMLHYIVVNARTGETMGSVPIQKGGLATFSVTAAIIAWFVSSFTIILIEAIVLTIIAYATDFDETSDKIMEALTPYLACTVIFSPFIFAILTGMFMQRKIKKYRHGSERHYYEKETMLLINNLKMTDEPNGIIQTDRVEVNRRNEDQILGYN